MTPLTTMRIIHLRLIGMLRARAESMMHQRLLRAIHTRTRRGQIVPFPIKRPTHEAPKMLQ